MSEIQPDQAFWDCVDGIIELANSQCESNNAGLVSEALVYAATRFSAFVVASNSESLADFREDKDEAVRYMSGQFRKMLEENYADYDANFTDYTR